MFHRFVTQDEEEERMNRKRKDAFNYHYLLRSFKQNQKPSSEEKRYIADRLNLKYDKVNIWFQNQRAKRRRYMTIIPFMKISIFTDQSTYYNIAGSEQKFTDRNGNARIDYITKNAETDQNPALHDYYQRRYSYNDTNIQKNSDYIGVKMHYSPRNTYSNPNLHNEERTIVDMGYSLSSIPYDEKNFDKYDNNAIEQNIHQNESTSIVHDIQRSKGNIETSKPPQSHFQSIITLRKKTPPFMRSLSTPDNFIHSKDGTTLPCTHFFFDHPTKKRKPQKITLHIFPTCNDLFIPTRKLKDYGHTSTFNNGDTVLVRGQPYRFKEISLLPPFHRH